jgi:hypothetical protein
LVRNQVSTGISFPEIVSTLSNRREANFGLEKSRLSTSSTDESGGNPISRGGVHSRLTTHEGAAFLPFARCSALGERQQRPPAPDSSVSPFPSFLLLMSSVRSSVASRPRRSLFVHSSARGKPLAAADVHPKPAGWSARRRPLRFAPPPQQACAPPPQGQMHSRARETEGG